MFGARSGATRRGKAARTGEDADRSAAVVSIFRRGGGGRPNDVRHLHVRIRDAPNAARPAVQPRVPRQVHRQMAQGEYCATLSARSLSGAPPSTTTTTPWHAHLSDWTHRSIVTRLSIRPPTHSTHPTHARCVTACACQPLTEPVLQRDRRKTRRANRFLVDCSRTALAPSAEATLPSFSTRSSRRGPRSTRHGRGNKGNETDGPVGSFRRVGRPSGARSTEASDRRRFAARGRNGTRRRREEVGELVDLRVAPAEQHTERLLRSHLPP